MNCEDGFFPITSVHRLDIKEALHLSDEKVAKITDDMMRDIARKMADDYCEQLFWDTCRLSRNTSQRGKESISRRKPWMPDNGSCR